MFQGLIESGLLLLQVETFDLFNDIIVEGFLVEKYLRFKSWTRQNLSAILFCCWTQRWLLIILSFAMSPIMILFLKSILIFFTKIIIKHLSWRFIEAWILIFNLLLLIKICMKVLLVQIKPIFPWLFHLFLPVFQYSWLSKRISFFQQIVIDMANLMR